MRLGLGLSLISLSVLALRGESGLAIAQEIIAALAGLFVIAGLWTPVMASLAGLDQIWIAVSFPRAGVWIHILLGILFASLAMLGPGAWSVDARLFGRMRLPNR
jgi:uncharacterized membrane protein YphA (DoxX/SURF4 family)